MSERWYVVDLKTNCVVNAVVWDGDTKKWAPPEGCQAIHEDYYTPSKEEMAVRAKAAAG